MIFKALPDPEIAEIMFKMPQKKRYKSAFRDSTFGEIKKHRYIEEV